MCLSHKQSIQSPSSWTELEIEPTKMENRSYMVERFDENRMEKYERGYLEQYKAGSQRRNVQDEKSKLEFQAKSKR